MRADVLGPLVVRGEAGEIPTGSPQQQALLVALVLRRGAPASTAELGVDPGPELQDLYTRMLRADPDLMGTGDRPRPAQLPAVPALFVGREHELRQDPGPARILVIAGLAGVGKTTLALRWAHRHAARFDDGQLYADLRATTPAGQRRNRPTCCTGSCWRSESRPPTSRPTLPHGRAGSGPHWPADEC